MKLAHTLIGATASSIGSPDITRPPSRRANDCQVAHAQPCGQLGVLPIGADVWVVNRTERVVLGPRHAVADQVRHPHLAKQHVQELVADDRKRKPVAAFLQL